MIAGRMNLVLLCFLLLFNIRMGLCQTTNNLTENYSQDHSAEDHWLPFVTFDIANFKNPPQKFGPMVRWWWPGNNVSKEELIRELKLLKTQGFSGVEIQPFSIGINSKASKDILNKWYSWDTESYYNNLHSVMKEAKRLGLIVDMTAGSGWPLSTPITTPKTGMKMLTYADTIVEAGEDIDMDLPKEIHSMENSFRTFEDLDFSLAKLEEVVAGRIVGDSSSQIRLEQASVSIITRNVQNNRINWRVPTEGDKWDIIAIYSIPTMEANPFAAKKDPLYVVNHFDSVTIHNAYDYLFGSRTGLKNYYGEPFRAIFNDSYELKADVFWPGKGFFSEFKKENGYDIKPFLPQIMIGNSNSLGFSGQHYKSKYIISKNGGGRLQYDYFQTTGNILIKQLIEGSDHWADSRGLLHRTQPYGPRGLNTIKAAGHSDIPETEQLFDGGTDGFIKLVTSGAHLYNRPIITQESYVFWQRAFMTTPQKLKALSNKSFAEGVNQIIYHGFPYRLMSDNYGIEGWSPFNSPYGGSNFSSHINEINPFWSDIKKVNNYISRSQYVMRSGKPKADVLIYDPGISFHVGPNPEEILVGGFFEGFEPKDGASIPDFKKEDKIFWEVVNKLQSSGITWDYVNEESLQKAEFKNGKIRIRGNNYKAIILPQIPFASLTSAKSINILAKKGANILIVGDLPSKQPSFYNYKKNDKITYDLMKETVNQAHSHHLASAGLMNHWIAELPKEIRYNGDYRFLRQAVRKLKNGDKIHYFWNISGEWQKISLKVSGKINTKNFYWLNPENGEVYKTKNKSEMVYVIAPFSSVFLYTTDKFVPDDLLSELRVPEVVHSKEITQIKKWAIQVDDIKYSDNPLFDWRGKDNLKYKSDKGEYISSFQLEKQEGKKYFIDLGQVFSTAEVYVNGQFAGKRIWSPYSFDITKLVNTGGNKIKVIVTPSLLNELIGLGKGTKEGEKYFQFNNKEDQLMPAGLIGPVILKSF